MNKIRNKTGMRSCVCAGGMVLLLVLSILLTAWGNRAAEATGNEVWVAIRTDGLDGTGTQADPFNGSTLARMNVLMQNKFPWEAPYVGNPLTIHFLAGTYYAITPWIVYDNWKIMGAGIDQTIFQTQADSTCTTSVGFTAWASETAPGASGVEISDLTIDCNVLNLRHPNRAFVYPQITDFASAYYGYRYETSRNDGNWDTMNVAYVYATTPSAWSSTTPYVLGDKVSRLGYWYICLAYNSLNNTPAQSPQSAYWGVLRNNGPSGVPAWSSTKTYQKGDEVSYSGDAYLCIYNSCKNKNPVPVPTAVHYWLVVNTAAPDPDVITYPLTVSAWTPGGNNRATRVKVINANGSSFFWREGFCIILRGDSCVVDSCVVEQFRGDYGTMISIANGQNNYVHNCRVTGGSGGKEMAYGGGALWDDSLFESNTCSNVYVASNIDSLHSNGVRFYNNTFLDCREIGIQVRVDLTNAWAYTPPAWIIIDGVYYYNDDYMLNRMDNLTIHNCYVTMQPGAPRGAIKIGDVGLSNVTIMWNTFGTTTGSAGGRAIEIVNTANANADVHDNVCETGMRNNVSTSGVNHWYNNYDDWIGGHMKDLQGNAIPWIY